VLIHLAEMTMTRTDHANLLSAIEATRVMLLSGKASAPEVSACLALCEAAMQQGRAANAIPLLQLVFDCHPAPDIAYMLGHALRLEQRLEEALGAFESIRGAQTAPAGLQFAKAQTRYELGLRAAADFEAAQRTLPANRDILRNRAAAMAAEGDGAGADALLTVALAQDPEWLDGHKSLATLRWTQGDPARFAESYAAACDLRPGNADLWLGWFAAVVQTRDWTESGSILDRAEAALGTTPAIQVSRLFVASESGDARRAEALIKQTAHIQGDTINLCRIRHFLRHGRLIEAEAVAIPQLLSPTAGLYWPYLSLIWRMADDARAYWLDRPDALIQSLPVDLSSAEYLELAEVLRALHTMQRPYAEQSVRGGTQTDRSVMLRREPILRLTRERWMAAIRSYVADLPPFEQGHPLLGAPREHLLIEGSWSVRLLSQGHNVPHTHTMGWLSTAFYISLPEASAMGPAPAGHIAFGTPPAELGIDLQPYRVIAPNVGQTAIFPSTTWHSTVPFDDGERLVLALDVRRPLY
jgi:Tfp pilus assembly protein PilF